MSTTAQNNPVMRRKPEVNSGDFPVGQKDPIKLSLDGRNIQNHSRWTTIDNTTNCRSM